MSDQDQQTDKLFVVVSGAAAFSWGRYATEAEALERRDYVRKNEPTASVFRRVGS